ncbi:MAG: undecaprenyl/decaprenyl-phosphate alpha-N-acetylglucosaminyl 1-phosphate transferase [Candidatus Omnitrophica bacterium]|nr:undecaprenyl/decaprenyl-phosphate alpha-N-acetylglucosaminyl 1-phosphate transferase [Candidatus Omnitrophota bacterium]
MNLLLVYLLAFAGAWLTSFLGLPLWRAWCRRIGLVDEPGHRKIHSAPIPLAGGLAVLTGLLAPLLAGMLALNFGWLGSPATGLLSYGLSRRAGQLSALLLGALGMVGLGWWDDKTELRPAVKFGAQLLIAVLVAGAGVRITLFVKSTLFSYAITVLWILSVTNAYNFMDNMNGLCAGLGAIGAWYFAWSAAAQGQYLVAILGALSFGALLGFLPYNFPRATAFLGDAGSHLIGYWLAVLAILPHFYTHQNPKSWAVLSPLLILAVPLADMCWVVVLRWRRGLPFYMGDTNHLSHRLVRRGWPPSTAVLLIWLLATILGGCAFALQG